MQLKLKNIGIIKESDINLNGLTVIAGYNDIGKNTIGKILFSIIKSVSGYKEDLEKDKETSIKKLLDNIYFSLRIRVSFSNNIFLRNIFYHVNFFDDIMASGIKAIDKRKKNLESMDESISGVTIKKIDKLIDIISQSNKKEEVIKRAFKKIFFSDFENEVLNKHKKENENFIINIKKFENEILMIKLNDFVNIDLYLYDEIFFNDATLIETLMVLNYSEVFEKAKSYFNMRDKNEILILLGLPNIIFHTKDLDSKLKESICNETNDELAEGIIVFYKLLCNFCSESSINSLYDFKKNHVVVYKNLDDLELEILEYLVMN